MMLVKEELITYLTLGHVHVSRQDYQFFSNLIKINMEGSITTGQDKLLNKLLDKYKRQLIKLGHDVEGLKKLEWRKPLIETTEEYKKAYLYLEGNKLIFKSPFSKKFINDLRSEGDNNTFVWDKNKKVYASDATTLALKVILKVSKKSFSELHLCDQLQNVLCTLEEYEKSVWNPTMYKVNGNYYIMACNSALGDAISSIDLNEDPKTLYELTKYGLDFDNSVVNNELQKFASSYYYETDTEHLHDIIEYVTRLGISEVRLESQALYSNTLYKELRNKLTECGIKIITHHELKEISRDEYPVLISFKTRKYIPQYSKSVSKIVSIKNNTPIDVK
jgi:hypothetical protein